MVSPMATNVPSNVGRIPHAGKLVEGLDPRATPEALDGQLVEAEHASRYWWATAFAKGARVLDLGCGLAYGAEVLAREGAREVVAVDAAEAVVEAARARLNGGVRVQRADLDHLPFEDRAFDLAVCFDVLDRVERPGHVLGELRRILAQGGVLLVSTSRGTPLPGDDRHPDAPPEEVEATLSERFGHVQLMRQHLTLAAAIAPGDMAAGEAGRRLEEAGVRKLGEGTPGEEVCTIAVCSDDPVAVPAPEVLLSHLVDVRRWVEREAAHRRELQRLSDRLRGQETELAERAKLLGQLAESERQLAQLPQLEQNLAEAQLERDQLVQEAQDHAGLRERLERAHREIEDLHSSLSWRLTTPLRKVKGAFRRGG